MERITSTTIIEFSGLAGAGKSTLCSALGDKFRNLNIDFIHDDELRVKLDKKRFLNSLSVWSFPLFFNCILLHDLGNSTKGLRYSISLYRLCLRYRWFEKYKPANVLLVDEGIAQVIVSIAGYECELKLKPKHVRAIKHIYRALPETFALNCIVEPEVALERIRRRNRNSGRLDLIADDEKLSVALKYNSSNLNCINGLLNSVIHIEPVYMEEPINGLIEKIIRFCDIGAYPRED